MRSFSSFITHRPATAGRDSAAKPAAAPKGDTAPRPARKRCLNEAAHKLYR